MRAKILNASAGSGKTYRLAYKYVRDVVENPLLYRHILAVTFTNKATEEMKSRILGEIHALASKAASAYLSDLTRELSLDEQAVRERARQSLSRILHDYSHFTVMTIDTFFQRILRAFIRELGIDLNYNIEIETATVLAKSADALIEQIRIDEQLRAWLSAFVEERIEDGKRWDVRDGIASLGKELFNQHSSPAASREELGRIVEQAVAAAKASRERFRALCAGTEVENKVAARYLREAADGAVKAPGATVRKHAEQVAEFYDRHVRSWNTAELLRENYRSFALLGDLYNKVRQLCSEENVMMLSQTRDILSEFIRENDAPFIYEKVGNRFERFMIDEFQDTAAAEWANFLPLLRNAMAQSEDTSVLIVGDIKQSIYRWRGGDWRILHARAAEELAVEDEVEVEHLQDNFRSLPQVVEFNNALIGKVVERDNRALNEMLAQAPAAALEGAIREELHDTLARAYEHHEQRTRKTGGGYVNVTAYEEEPPLVERIKELIDKGFLPRDMMILVRGATDGARVAGMLLDFKQANTDERYRFDVMTQEALTIGAAPICSFVTACMRLAVDVSDSIHRALFNRFLGRGAFDAALSNEQIAFFGTLRLLPPEEAFERIVMRFSLQERVDEIAYLQALHEQVIRFTTSRIADIPLFLQWWDERGSSRSLSVERSERTIEIMTIHKAKGLEKKVVLIPYCNWPLAPKASGFTPNIVWAAGEGLEQIGQFPVRYKAAMGESHFSADYYREMVYAHVDNVNLLYVAITRAVESLHIFIPTRNGRATGVGQLVLETMESGTDEASESRDRLRAMPSRKEEGRWPKWKVESEKQKTFTRRSDVNAQLSTFTFGEFTGPVQSILNSQFSILNLLTDYPTAEPDLQLRMPSRRYFEEGSTELSPRNFGILMHKAFAEARTAEEVVQAIHAMRQDGVIGAAEAERLVRMVDAALADPVVAAWFDPGWEVVRSENEIILPQNGGATTTRRPDRVMMRGKRAVVVDYKFGEQVREEHGGQIRTYVQLLSQMGYDDVEGYLWYVKLGKTQRV